MPHMTKKGYVRYHEKGLRNKYAHRIVMAFACRQQSYYALDPNEGLPHGFSVEHVDHNRGHNCIENLLLLETVIHDWLSFDTLKHKQKRK